ncbi:MAG: hypothetical protein GY758_35190 [Fuerstiella sp.]|nr:hypothetical protein [Fuerstiella sp.]MCP4507201.1 hypothetical protein [Fuerstiella sp.]
MSRQIRQRQPDRGMMVTMPKPDPEYTIALGDNPNTDVAGLSCCIFL